MRSTVCRPGKERAVHRVVRVFAVIEEFFEGIDRTNGPPCYSDINHVAILKLIGFTIPQDFQLLIDERDIPQTQTRFGFGACTKLARS